MAILLRETAGSTQYHMKHFLAVFMKQMVIFSIRKNIDIFLRVISSVSHFIFSPAILAEFITVIDVYQSIIIIIEITITVFYQALRFGKSA